MIIDVSLEKIKSDKYFLDLFINAKFNKLNVNCNILQGDFFSDSFHYFPITKNNETLAITDIGSVRFVPLLEGKENK